MNDPEPAKSSAREAALKQAAEAYCAIVGGSLSAGVYAAISYYFTIGDSNILYRVEKEGGRGSQLIVGECPALSGGTLGNLFQRAYADGEALGRAKQAILWPVPAEEDGK